MFKSQHYRAKADRYGDLIKTSNSAEESSKLQELENRFASLADNEQGLADSYYNAVRVGEKNRTRDTVLAAEEEHVLRCLGAAIVMEWNTLPTMLQREIFDISGSVGRLLETDALRGQIARFLHKHKDDGGFSKLTRPEDTHSDARLGAMALSRWENEGGAVRDGLPL